jgi:hypothetical protein
MEIDSTSLSDPEGRVHSDPEGRVHSDPEGRVHSDPEGRVNSDVKISRQYSTMTISKYETSEYDSNDMKIALGKYSIQNSDLSVPFISPSGNYIIVEDGETINVIKRQYKSVQRVSLRTFLYRTKLRLFGFINENQYIYTIDNRFLELRDLNVHEIPDVKLNLESSPKMGSGLLSFLTDGNDFCKESDVKSISKRLQNKYTVKGIVKIFRLHETPDNETVVIFNKSCVEIHNVNKNWSTIRGWKHTIVNDAFRITDPLDESNGDKSGMKFLLHNYYNYNTIVEIKSSRKSDHYVQTKSDIFTRKLEVSHDHSAFRGGIPYSKTQALVHTEQNIYTLDLSPPWKETKVEFDFKLPPIKRLEYNRTLNLLVLSPVNGTDAFIFINMRKVDLGKGIKVEDGHYRIVSQDSGQSDIHILEHSYKSYFLNKSTCRDMFLELISTDLVNVVMRYIS